MWYLGKLQKTRQCACGRAPGPQMLAHREENELLSKAMVSSVSLGMYLGYIRPKSFPGGSDDKESACNAGDPGLGRSLSWKDSLEKGMAAPSNTLAWRILWIEATVHGVTKSKTQLSD